MISLKDFHIRSHQTKRLIIIKSINKEQKIMYPSLNLPCSPKNLLIGSVQTNVASQTQFPAASGISRLPLLPKALPAKYPTKRTEKAILQIS